MKRTQLMRNPAPVLGEMPQAEEDTADGADRDQDADEEEDGSSAAPRGVLPAAAVYRESVFDDTDFYHELLRELSTCGRRRFLLFHLPVLCSLRGPFKSGAAL